MNGIASSRRVRHVEVIAAALILLLCIGVLGSRIWSIGQRSQRQAVDSAGAAFVAGLQMLQAESRLPGRRRLNALGYPTGRTGTLATDEDCALIWDETMQNAAESVAHYVDDANGGHCEFGLIGAARSRVQIFYSPLGIDEKTSSLGRTPESLARGTHVHVELGGRSS